MRVAISSADTPRGPVVAAGPQLNEMISKARHDLRNPLGHILGFSEMLQEEARALGYEHFTSDFDVINHAANQMIAQINQCLDWQKIEARLADISELKQQITSQSSKIVTTAERMALLSRALKEDVFSADLARSSTSGWI